MIDQVWEQCYETFVPGGRICVVVDHTNMDDGEETGLVTEKPAPQPEDIVHYRDFVSILANTLEARVRSEETPNMDVL